MDECTGIVELPGMVVHACNPSILKVEGGRLRMQISFLLHERSEASLGYMNKQTGELMLLKVIAE